MKTTNIPLQLSLIIGVLAGAILVASVAFLVMLDAAYEESGRAARDGAAELTRTFTLLERVAGAEDAVQRFVRLKDADALESALAEIEANRKRMGELIGLTGPNGAKIRAQYDPAIAAELQVIDAVLKGDGGLAHDRFMEVASPRYQAVKAAVREYFTAAQQTTEQTMVDNAARARRRVIFPLIVGDLAFAALILYLWRVRHRIATRLVAFSTTLMESSAQLADTSAQVTSSSQSVSDGVNRQAASLEETSASFEEIGAAASQNAERAHQAKDLAGEACGAAETGHQDMREMTDAMDAIKGASGAIAGIIKTIDEIAFQTNLLALNAAVEAARAGQAGLGFAVVADEVRALAQRSATAARETAASVEQVIGRSDRGVEVSGKVAKSLEDIVTRTRRVDALVGQIATASEQQRQGIEQVSSAMADMEKVTQSGAAAAEETAATAVELNAQAEALRGIVEELQQMAGDRSYARAARQSSALADPVLASHRAA